MDADTPLSLAEFGTFAGTEAGLLDDLLAALEEKRFAAGEKIFTRGDPGREIFFIRKGSVRIDLPLAGGMTEHLATFGRGDFFGDMAFLVKGGRSADALAEDEVWLFSMDRSVFNELSLKDPRLGEMLFFRLASALAERLRQTDVIIKTLVES